MQRRHQAVRAKRNAQRAQESATIQALVYKSQSLLGSDPQQSLNIALQAERLDPNTLIEDALRQALLATRGLRVMRAGGSTPDAAFSPDGGLIVTAGPHDARVFDVRTGRHVATLQTGARVSKATFSSDGRTLVTVDGDRKAVLWETSDWKATHELADGHPVTSAAFSNDGQFVVTTSNHIINVWHAATGGLVARIGQKTPVLGAVFNRDASQVLTFGSDPVAEVRDIATHGIVLKLDQLGSVTDALHSPDGLLIATTGRDGSTKLWDAETGT